MYLVQPWLNLELSRGKLPEQVIIKREPEEDVQVKSEPVELISTPY